MKSFSDAMRKAQRYVSRAREYCRHPLFADTFKHLREAESALGKALSAYQPAEHRMKVMEWDRRRDEDRRFLAAHAAVAEQMRQQEEADRAETDRHADDEEQQRRDREQQDRIAEEDEQLVQRRLLER